MRMLLGSGAAKMGVSQNEVTDFLFFYLKKNKKTGDTSGDNPTGPNTFTEKGLGDFKETVSRNHECSAGDYLQLSQVGKVGKGFRTDGSQFVVAEISENKQKVAHYKTGNNNYLKYLQGNGVSHLLLLLSLAFFSTLNKDPNQ